MAKKQNPRELLEQVLNLMSKDIDEIEKMSGKLDGEVSASLVRYSDALLKIVKDADNQKEVEREKLSTMSTEELARKAKEYLERKK